MKRFNQFKKFLTTTYPLDNRGGITFALLVILLISAFYIAGGFFKIQYSPVPTDPDLNLLQDQFARYDNLQIGRLRFARRIITPPPNVGIPPIVTITATPTIPDSVPVPEPTTGELCNGVIYAPNPANPRDLLPISTGRLVKKSDAGTCCWIHAYTDDCSVCCSGLCINKDYENKYGPPPPPPAGAKYWCDAKPVIYLYPEKDTIINVTLKVPGTIPVSIPTYPDNGWRNILAKPDGSLWYQGKLYKELFYEAAITPISPPTHGIYTEKGQLTQTLDSITKQLGLSITERKEFLTYWLPRLKDIPEKYVFISYYDAIEKKPIDTVIIEPKPTTFIEFIMYFRGANTIGSEEQLRLPTTIPQRIGFTAVEWGGIVDE